MKHQEKQKNRPPLYIEDLKTYRSNNMTHISQDIPSTHKLPRLLLQTLLAAMALMFTALPAWSFQVQGAEDDYRFSNLTNRNGLRNSHITAILQDNKGYMWFGTLSGLARYDGFRTKMFLYSNDNKHSLPNNTVDDIQQDADGDLWIHTAVGYCRYIYANEVFEREADTWLAKFGIKGAVAKVFIDKQKNTWVIIYGQGCYFIPAKGKKAFRFDYPLNGKTKKSPTLLTNDLITDIDDYHGNVVVTFADGSFSCLDGNAHRILWTNNNLKKFRLNETFYNFVDSENNFWLFYGNKAFIYDSLQKQWYDNTAAFLRSKGIDPLMHEPFFIRDMQTSADGRLWVATDHDGLLLVDYHNRKSRQFLKNDLLRESLPDNSLQKVYIDSHNALWVGTYKNGVAYFSPSSTRFSTIPLGDICAIAQDKTGNLWCGTNDKGIVCYNPKTGQSQHFTTKETGLKTDVVVCAYCMSDGSLYFGTFNGGLARYSHGTWKAWSAAPKGLANNSVWCLGEDKAHRLLIGTLGSGLQIFNPRTETFATFNMKNTKLACDYINSISPAKGNNVLLGHSQNISFFNTSNGKTSNLSSSRQGTSFPSPSVNYAMMDSRGIIWMASPAGITMYDPTTGQLENVNELNGTQGAVGCMVVESKDHNMWLISEFLITHVKLSKDTDGKWMLSMSSYNTYDGLQSGQFNYRSACLLQDGSIAVGGQEGINIIPTTSEEPSNLDAKVLFSGLVLFDTPIAAGEEYEGRVVLEESLDSCRKLNLKADENAFTILLAADEVSIPSHCRFLYRMEGVSDKWMLTPEGNPSVTFTNLSPGNYTLQVKVVNGDGTLSEAISQLHIHVCPPFYLSSWAILLYVVLIVGILFYCRKRMLEKQREKYEREKMEENVRKTEEMNEMKLTFFTNVSHELRTPLTLILSPLASLVKEETDHNKHHKLELIQRNAVRLLGLVNQILDFRKMEKTTTDLTLTTIDIVPFLHDLSNSFAQLANNNIRFSFRSDIKHLVMVFDVDKMGKIVNNLLSNAYKFTPDGGTVSMTVSFKENDMLHITVADTGKGISDEEKKKVFERFYQTDNNTTDGSRGTGIGLNLVMRLVQMHEGKVYVEDNPGGGAVFIVELPVKGNGNVEETGNEHKTEKSAETNIAAKQGNAAERESTLIQATRENAVKTVTEGSTLPAANKDKRTVLLVDDSDDFRDFMHEELAPLYRVVEAVDGKDAWEKMQQERPDIILSDVMMPVMDGNMLCRMVKGDPLLATIPFVMLTARLADEHQKEGYENGADAYITKPFDVDLLKVRMGNFLKNTGEQATEQQEPEKAEEAEKAQSAFSMSEHDRKFMAQVDAYITDNMSDADASVEAMSNHLCMSRVQLYKRMLALTGTTPSEYMRAKRIKRAEEMMHSNDYNISEIAYNVGFNNPRYFSKYFQEAYGMTPSQYRKKLANDKKA